MTQQEIETHKQHLLDEFREQYLFPSVCIAVDLVRTAVATTEDRIREGYLPPLAGPALNRVIAMEYLYRNSDLDLNYNEPVCCTPFYFEALKDEILKD